MFNILLLSNLIQIFLDFFFLEPLIIINELFY